MTIRNYHIGHPRYTNYGPTIDSPETFIGDVIIYTRQVLPSDKIEEVNNYLIEIGKILQSHTRSCTYILYYNAVIFICLIHYFQQGRRRHIIIDS
jgi:hypothetical protein